MKKYIWGLDLSMKNSGIAIFDGTTPVCITSIPTSDKQTHGERLKIIYDRIIELKTVYPPEVICQERGFSRFNLSTAAINQVVGVVLLAFYDEEVIMYPPKTVKMTIASNGNATKEAVEEAILKMYPESEFHNNDESDAFGVAITYLKKKGIL